MDFSEIKLTPDFKFNQSLANQLAYTITKGNKDRLPIYCAAFQSESDYFWFSPLWLHREADWFAHFEIYQYSSKDYKGKWYLQLHLEHKHRLNLEKLIQNPNKEYLIEEAYPVLVDPVKVAVAQIRCEALRQHLLKKLPVNAQPDLYEWEDWGNPNSCLTFHPKKDLESLEEALQLIPPFYQLIVATLRQDTPSVLQEMVGSIVS